jgi:saccharopine dehydrogenase-like NADP-dependent oxidoreductase
MYQMTSHDEAFEKYAVQGTGWQTGVPAACAAIMFAKGLICERGMLAPECIDPNSADGSRGSLETRKSVFGNYTKHPLARTFRIQVL